MTYTFTLAGAYTMVVQMGKSHIAGSPFAVAVGASSVSVAHSLIAGAGLTLATAGVEGGFVLQPKDRFSNAVLDRGSFAGLFLIRYSGPAVGDVSVQPFGSRYKESSLLTTYWSESTYSSR